jgi:hypothetical protein
MSNYPPEKNKSKFLITERSCNYILRSVQARKENYPYSYVVENLGQSVNVIVNRPWTYANHLLLDFIGHEFFEKGYQNIVDKRNTWKNEGSSSLLYSIDALKEQQHVERTPDLEPHAHWLEKYLNARKKEQELIKNAEYGDELTETKNQIAQLQEEVDSRLLEKSDKIFKIQTNGRGGFLIEINLRNFAKRYEDFFAQSRRFEYLPELIKRTSEVKFTFDYPLRHPVIKTYQYNGETKTKIIDTRLETVKVENSSFFNYEIKNGNLLVKFNTFLGKVYAHNLLTLNTDWFEEDYLKLNGYASAIYRRFFSTRRKVEDLELRDLVEFFGFANNCRYPAIIRQAFEDIKNAGLINDYKIIVNGGKFSKGYIEVDKSSK